MKTIIRVLDFVNGFGNGSISEFYGLRRYLKRHIRPNSIFFDVGANIGDFADLYISSCGPASKIILVEPNPILAISLKKKFHSEEEVFIMENVVGCFDGSNEIYLKIPVDAKWNGISRINNFVEDKFFDIEYATHQVVGISLDDIIEQNKLDKVDFIKIDTEGFDFSVIQSMEKSLINGKVQNFYFEFGPANISTKVFFRDIVDFLDSLSIKYAIYRFNPFGKFIKVEYSIWNEYFRGNTNYLVIIE